MIARAEQQIGWMGLRLTVPADWYLTRHSLAPEKGQLALADRRAQRMQLNWIDCEATPDVSRMLEEYRQSVRGAADASDSEIELRALQGLIHWRGVHRIEADGLLTRALRFDRPTSRLVEVIVATDLSQCDAGGEDAVEVAINEARQLLAGVDVLSKGQDGAYWQLFDLKVQTQGPSHSQANPGQTDRVKSKQDRWRLIETSLKPGDSTLRFQHADDKPRRGRVREVWVRRMGMADAWYAQRYGSNLERVLIDQADGVDVTPQRLTRQGYGVVTSDAWEAGPRIRRVVRTARRRHDVLWHDATCNAVFLVTSLYPPKRPIDLSRFMINDKAVPVRAEVLS